MADVVGEIYHAMQDFDPKSILNPPYLEVESDDTEVGKASREAIILWGLCEHTYVQLRNTEHSHLSSLIDERGELNENEFRKKPNLEYMNVFLRMELLEELFRNQILADCPNLHGFDSFRICAGWTVIVKGPKQETCISTSSDSFLLH